MKHLFKLMLSMFTLCFMPTPPCGAALTDNAEDFFLEHPSLNTVERKFFEIYQGFRISLQALRAKETVDTKKAMAQQIEALTFLAQNMHDPIARRHASVLIRYATQRIQDPTARPKTGRSTSSALPSSKTRMAQPQPLPVAHSPRTRPVDRTSPRPSHLAVEGTSKKPSTPVAKKVPSPRSHHSASPRLHHKKDPDIPEIPGEAEPKELDAAMEVLKKSKNGRALKALATFRRWQVAVQNNTHVAAGPALRQELKGYLAELETESGDVELLYKIKQAINLFLTIMDRVLGKKPDLPPASARTLPPRLDLAALEKKTIKPALKSANTRSPGARSHVSFAVEEGSPTLHRYSPEPDDAFTASLKTQRVALVASSPPPTPRRDEVPGSATPKHKKSPVSHVPASSSRHHIPKSLAQPSHTKSLSARPLITRKQDFSVTIIPMTPQKGLDCGFHAACVAQTLARYLADRRGSFVQTEVEALTKAINIQPTKKAFNGHYRPLAPALDGEEVRDLLLSLIEGSTCTDADTFYFETPYYTCVQVDAVNATFAEALRTMARGRLLLRHAREVGITPEDINTHLITPSQKTNTQGHIEINYASKKAFEKNGVHMTMDHLLELRQYQSDLKDAKDNNLARLREALHTPGKNLILVWQSHTGDTASIGHWTTQLIRQNTIYVFDSLNQRKLPKHFEGFIRQLMDYPDAKERREHLEYLQAVFG